MIDDTALAARLATRWLGRAHEHHATLRSTNDRALAWADAGAPHGALVTADAQTSGRGRRGRRWASPPGVSLYATVVLRPSRADVGALGLAFGLGLRQGLPLPVGLKWPNDLVVEGRKVGGVLCEARWEDGLPVVAAGFGINVRARDWPPPLGEIATTLEDEGVAVDDPTGLLADVLLALEDTLDRYLRAGFAAIRDRYVAACTVLGRPIRLGDADDPGRAERVVAVDLDDDGALLVRRHPGAGLARVEAADVWLAER